MTLGTRGGVVDHLVAQARLDQVHHFRPQAWAVQQFDGVALGGVAAFLLHVAFGRQDAAVGRAQTDAGG